MICDVAKYQGKIDWAKLAPAIEDGYVAINASGKWANQGDPQYDNNVTGAVLHGVPFHAFHFLYCLTVEEAKRDAGLFYRIVKARGIWPLFWVLDCEGGWGIPAKQARPVAEAFEAELRRLAREQGPGEIRVGLYIGHNVYKSYALDYGRYDYVWIPRYGKNDGTQAGSTRPDWPCDVWQYTSKGRLPGISGDVDLDMLIGDKPMEFFTGKAEQKKEGDTMFTGKQLAEFCEQVYKAGWVYWYGTYGNPCTTSLYNSKKKQYPAHYTADRAAGYKKDIDGKKTCADCVGMIKGFFWKSGDLAAKPVYRANNCPDVSANGMIKLCKQTGPIKTIPDEQGLVVWKDGHIGVYVGGGYTVEMKGFNYDCKRVKVTAGPWTKWGRLPATMISYDPAPEPKPEPQGLRRGDYGTAVRAMQEALLKWDAKCLPKYGADGDFGAETEKAVKAFQQAAGLPVTGVYDEATRAALTGTQPVQHHDVVVTGSSVNVRSGPGTSGTRILAVVHKGDVLPWQGEDRIVDGTAWHLVEFEGVNAWISGKFSKVV